MKDLRTDQSSMLWLPDVLRGEKGKWQCREGICSLWKFWHLISVCKEMPRLWCRGHPGSHICLNSTSASNLLDDLTFEVAVLKMALFSVPSLGRQIWSTFKTESPPASSHFANVLILVSLHLPIPAPAHNDPLCPRPPPLASASASSAPRAVGTQSIIIIAIKKKKKKNSSTARVFLQLAFKQQLKILSSPKVRKSYVWNISLRLWENNSVYSSVCEHWMNGNSSSNCLFLS